MTAPATMASLQAAFDNRTDPRHEDHSDEAIESVADDLYEALTSPKGSDEVDDERVQLNIDVEAMRAAYQALKRGDYQTAADAFAVVFLNACEAAANDEAADVYAARCDAEG